MHADVIQQRGGLAEIAVTPFTADHFPGGSLLARSLHNVAGGASSRTVIVLSPQM